MSKTLDRLLAKMGKTTDNTHPLSKLGRVVRRKGVEDTSELQRVLRVPRRQWRGSQDDMAAMLTEWLKRPGGTMSLRPIQAAALQDMHDFGGLFAPIRVGGGKTLISLLAARVLESRRPVLLIPAKLRHKTQVEADDLSVHWLFPRPTVISYELLGRAQAADKLAEIQPDLIIADETHKLKSTKAAVTRRVARWFKAHPKTAFVCMSGTITMRSLWDYAHLLEWALPEMLFPLPRSWPELTEWADCIDVKRDPLAQRMAAGALVQLCNDEERAELATDDIGPIRKAWRRRLTDTPGVIATEDRALGTSLNIQSTRVHLPKMEAAFSHLRSHWETPDGWSCAEAVDVWRHCRELACGFYYKWDPRPPDEWMDARREFHAQIREILKHNQRRLDSMLPVVRAIDAGHYRSEPLRRWRAVRDTFLPNTVPVWISRAVVNSVRNWLEQGPGIAWVEHRAVAEALYPHASVYGRQGRNQHGDPIEEADPNTAIVCSIGSNSEGRNLQGWNRNLVVSCAGNGAVWEQLQGRTHRDGQEADEVTFEVMINCVEQWTAFQQALQDSKYIQDTTGQEQKLLYADVDMPSASDIGGRDGPLWNR